MIEATAGSPAKGPMVLVVAGDTDGNLGDRAIFEATAALIRRDWPGASIVTPATHRRPDGATDGIATIPRGPGGFLPLLRHARKADVVIFGGGGLLQDDDSLLKVPYWAVRLAILRALNPAVIGWSLGVGPLRTGFSRFFARIALGFLGSVTVRDHKAAASVTQAGRPEPKIVPDPAITLQPAPPEIAAAILADHGVGAAEGLRVGVALRRYFPPRSRLVPNRIAAALGLGSRDEAAMTDRLATLVAAALDKLAEEQPVQAIFMPSYDRAHEGDTRLAKAVCARLKTARGTVLRLDGPAAYKAVCGTVDLMLAGRMHPAILAAGMGRPVCGLGYNQKFAGFFSLIGRSDCLIDVAALMAADKPDGLVACLGRAREAGPPGAGVIDELAARVRDALRTQLARAGLQGKNRT